MRERRRCRSATHIPPEEGLDAEVPLKSKGGWGEESQSRSDMSYGRRGDVPQRLHNGIVDPQEWWLVNVNRIDGGQSFAGDTLRTGTSKTCPTAIVGPVNLFIALASPSSWRPPQNLALRGF